MKIFLKYFAILMGFILLVASTFIYTSFNGLPWKKYTIAKEIYVYLEDRYQQPFEIKDKMYNFKDGSYGIAVTPVGEPELRFTAWEGYGKHEFIDYYPEAVWEKQVYDEFSGIVNRIFPEHIRYHVSTAMGESSDLVTGPEIPHYQDVDVLIRISVGTKGSFIDQDSEYERMLDVISEVKKVDAPIEMSFKYERTTEQKEEVIRLEPKMISEINTIEDIKRLGRVRVWPTN